MTVELGSTLTAAELVGLLESEHLIVDAGLELLDSDNVLIEDITDDFVADGSSVQRGMYRTVHGTARLRVSRDIQWGSQRLRPYLLLSDDDVTFYRWTLGTFLPTVPERRVADSPVVFDVECMDLLDVLNTPSAGYSLAAGGNIIDAVEALIAAAGESHTIDQTAASTVTASEKVYPIGDNWTTLGIVNDLLASIGYLGVYVDKFGTFRSQPYRSPADRPTVWTYNADSTSTTVAEDRTSLADYYQAANTIVAINDDPELDVPVDGDGIYTVVNQSDGPTSIDARGGRVIRRIVTGEYANQAALVTAATEALDAEKRVANFVELSVSPTPVHGHFDVVKLIDSSIPTSDRFLVTDWELPLDGGDMRLSLRGV